MSRKRDTFVISGADYARRMDKKKLSGGITAKNLGVIQGPRKKNNPSRPFYLVRFRRN
jgi:hypothetical protein